MAAWFDVRLDVRLDARLQEETIEKRPRGDRDSVPVGVFVLVVVVGATGFDDVEREAVLELHAGGAEDGAQRARGASLFANDFTDVSGRDVEAEHRGVLIGEDFDLDRVGIVDQGAGDLRHQGLHFGHSEVVVGQRSRVGHSYTSREYYACTAVREPLLSYMEGSRRLPL